MISAPIGASALLEAPTKPLTDLQLGADGEYVIQLIVTDGNGGVSFASTVIDTLVDPVRVDAGMPITVALGEALSLSPTVEGDIASTRWSVSAARGIDPESITISDVDALAPTVTLAFDACVSAADCAGTVVLELVATGADGSQESDTVTLSLVNSRPVADAGPGRLAIAGGTISIDGTASVDFDGGTLTHSWSLLHAPEDSALSLTAQDSSGSSFDAVIDARGIYVFQLIVSDGTLQGLPVTVTIDASNTAPVAVAATDSFQAFIGDSIPLNASGSFDPDNDPLSYAWMVSSAPDGSSATFDNPASVTPTFIPDTQGEFVFTVRVNDGQIVSNPATVNLTVLNREPVAAIASLPSDAVTGVPLVLDAAASSDPDGDALAYAWTIVSAPSGSTAVLEAPAVVETSLVPDLPGTYEIALEVTDGTATTNAITSISVIAANQPPSVAPLADANVPLGSTLTLAIDATDPDGDALEYGIQPIPLPEGASFDAVSGTLTWRPVVAGSQTFVISVSDGSETVYEEVTATVTAPDVVGPTILSGTIIDPQTGAPVEGAAVNVDGIAVTTDSAGGFSLDLGDTAGTVSVQVSGPDGSYGASGFATDLIAQVDNPLGSIAAVPLGDETPLSETEDTVVATDTGVTVTITPGSASDPSGNPFTGDVAVVDLPVASTGPISVTGFEACRLSTLQPAGTTFNPPAQVSVPNEDGLEPGTGAVLWAYSATLAKYVQTGQGEVNASGATIRTTSGGLQTGTSFVFVPLGLNAEPSADQAENFYIPSLLGEGNATARINPPSYTTYGEERSSTLIYNSATAAPRPIIALDLTIPAAAGIPNFFQTELTVGGKVVAEQVFTKPEGANGAALQESLDETIRQAVQFDGSDFETGTYEYTLTIISRYDCSATGTSYSGDVLINNKSDSPYGSGWWPKDLARIIPQADGSVVIDEGDGVLKSFEKEVEPLVFGLNPLILDYARPNLIFDDFDGDGDIDPLIHELVLSQSTVEFNNGDESFSKSATDLIGEAIDDPGPDGGNFFPDILTFASGDLNGDNRSDVVYAG